jgi:hypothetical protein
MISNNRLSARIDAASSSLLRAHRLVTDDRLALSPEAIRPTAVSRDDVLLVLSPCFPRIFALRPQIAGVLQEFDLRAIDRQPLYALDFVYCGAMADLARTFGPASDLDADEWDSERNRAATLLMDAYDDVRGAVVLAGADVRRVAPALETSSDDEAAETEHWASPARAAA